MKIFAKRTKRKISTACLPKNEDRTTFASDPVVEKLLQKDPSEWNSKERRMVMRYQKRKAEKSKEDAESKSYDEQVERADQGEEIERKKDSSDRDSNDDSGSQDTSDSDSSDDEDGNEAIEATLKQESETVTESITSDSKSQEEKVNPNDEIFKLLEQLNSKMKRTLSRKLDREGVSALDEVRNEANRILGIDASKQSSKKRGPDQDYNTVDEAKGKSKKKRKKESDWSALPPEERLRREEQRRKQKEAAERRARGEDKTAGYKHPLNSERRRANRRKPKWKNIAKEVSNEHNTSGYEVRKQRALMF